MKPAVAVGSRELKTRLGTYLRRVRAGQRIVVTERGSPVAELRRLDDGLDARLARLQAAGLVTAPTRQTLGRLRAVVLRRGPSLAKAIIEGREDRF